MKIVQINSFCGSGSTGKICVAISELLTAKNIENYILYAMGDSNYPLGIKYMSWVGVKFQALLSKIFGNYGFQSRAATKRLIKKLQEISPDIVQLHNLHSHNVNLELLFSYFKENNIKLIWTFHDCWAFTAYCPHYTLAQCNQWLEGCKKCSEFKKYSWIFDRSKWLYRTKKSLAQNLDLTIVTPSQWLADEVEKSFFKEFPVQVIHNGIDLEIFHPTTSDFRKHYNIPDDKLIILGVAFDWGIRKGLDVFITLASHLDANKYQIVLVGTNDTIDKNLPDNIISIHRTQNQQELAEIYTSADLFVNPTREENYPTVNMEAIACGTPVLTFNTGGSPEIPDGTCGSVVPCDDVDALEREIVRICETHPFTKEACLERAKAFDMNERYNEYIKLYKKRDSIK